MLDLRIVIFIELREISVKKNTITQFNSKLQYDIIHKIRTQFQVNKIF